MAFGVTKFRQRCKVSGVAELQSMFGNFRHVSKFQELQEFQWLFEFQVSSS